MLIVLLLLGSSYESNLLGNGASELSNASTVAVTARRAFSKLMNGFNRELSSVSHFEESSDSARYGSDLKSTLAYHLGLGLQRLLSENKHTWKGHGYVASLVRLLFLPLNSDHSSTFQVNIP